MALPQPTTEVRRFRQEKYVDVVRWLPPISTLYRHAVLACIDTKSPHLASVEIHSLNPQIHPKDLRCVATWDSPSRISCLKTTQYGSRPLVVASTVEGSLCFLGAWEDGAIVEIGVAKEIHEGLIIGVDVADNGEYCVTLGEDCKVNLMTIGSSGINTSCFYKSKKLDYTAVKWASSSEFATGGKFGLQWWDKRMRGGPVSQFKNNWAHGESPEVINSVDIHPSQKHTCLAGGTLGLVFLWDLRWPQQAVVLSGVEIGSNVWEVQFDGYDRSSSISSWLPAVLKGSEDGIVAVMKQGAESVELMAEPYPINNFDINKHNPSDIICSYECFGVAIASRP